MEYLTQQWQVSLDPGAPPPRVSFIAKQVLAAVSCFILQKKLTIQNKKSIHPLAAAVFA
jgi:hypothetical protein